MRTFRKLEPIFVMQLWLGVLLAFPATATTYYVDRKIGKDTNTGLSQTAGSNGPLYSIRAALEKPLVGGDIVEIKPTGTYTENLVMRKSGLPGKPIIIRGFGYPNASRPLIKFSDTSKAARFELYAGNRTLIAWVTIQGLEITNSASQSIKYTYADNLTLQGNYIHDSVNSGILGSGFQVVIDRNLIVRAGKQYTWGHGMYITGQEGRITNNVIVGAPKFGIQTAGYQLEDGPHPKYGNFKKNLIANNTIAYCGDSGIVIWAMDYYGPAYSNDDNDFVNNLLYENGGTSSSGANGIKNLSSGKQTVGNRIKNNLSYGTSPGPMRFLYAGPGKLFTLSNNLPATAEKNGPPPLLVNAPSTFTGNFDLHLTAQSPAINTGLNLTSYGVTTDFEGKPRPATGAFNIGAYEFRKGGTGGGAGSGGNSGTGGGNSGTGGGNSGTGGGNSGTGGGNSGTGGGNSGTGGGDSGTGGGGSGTGGGGSGTGGGGSGTGGADSETGGADSETGGADSETGNSGGGDEMMSGEIGCQSAFGVVWGSLPLLAFLLRRRSRYERCTTEP